MTGFAGYLVKQKSFRLFNIPLNTLPERPGELLVLSLFSLSKLSDLSDLAKLSDLSDLAKLSNLTWTSPDGSLVEIAIREIVTYEIAICLCSLKEILRERTH